MKLRIVQLAGFPSIVAAVACGAILGIDDGEPFKEGDEGRSPPDAANPTDDAEGEGDAGTVVIPPLRDAQCSPVTCALVHGQCDKYNACRIDCTTKDCLGEQLCPVDTDCQIDCRDDKRCAGLTCSGGKSCAIYCGEDSCVGAACTSGACTFDCGAKGACKDVSCDGGACTFDCHGKGSCPESLRAEADRCEIKCTGDASCPGGAPLSCGSSHTSSITCEPTTCKDRRLYCAPTAGGTCQIECPVGACAKGACCLADAGSTCIVQDDVKQDCR